MAATDQKPSDTQKLIETIAREIILRRWLVVFLIGLVSISFDFYKNRTVIDDPASYGELIEIVIEGLVLPIVGGILLQFASISNANYSYLVKYQSLKEALANQVDNAPQWGQLLRTMAEFPRSFLHLSGTIVAVVDQPGGNIETVARWGFYELESPPQTVLEICKNCQTISSPTLQKSPVVRLCMSDSILPHQLKRYCVPLAAGNKIAAVLYLYTSTEQEFTSDEQKILNALAADMGVAINNAVQKLVSRELVENSKSERRQITRVLHDNLAQSLITMRNKLDLILLHQQGDPSAPANGKLISDLTQLREITDDAYLNVRSMLKDMEANTPVELAASMKEYLQSFGQESGIEINHTNQGSPRSIRASVALQVMYIFTEVLANIQAHADATKISVSQIWNDSFLTLEISDNGRGFNSLASQKAGHLGLAIIQERAQEIKARLTIKSEPNTGTAITLMLPLTPL